jgi:hypothetical protein
MDSPVLDALILGMDAALPVARAIRSGRKG